MSIVSLRRPPTRRRCPGSATSRSGSSLIKVVAVFVFLVVMTLFSIVFERKVVGRMQNRIGPNRTGPWGILQSLADGMKLAFKEEIIPVLADKPVYFLAPILSAVPAFLAFSVIPFGPEVSIVRPPDRRCSSPTCRSACSWSSPARRSACTASCCPAGRPARPTRCSAACARRRR